MDDMQAQTCTCTCTHTHTHTQFDDVPSKAKTGNFQTRLIVRDVTGKYTWDCAVLYGQEPTTTQSGKCVCVRIHVCDSVCVMCTLYEYTVQFLFCPPTRKWFNHLQVDPTKHTYVTTMLACKQCVVFFHLIMPAMLCLGLYCVHDLTCVFVVSVINNAVCNFECLQTLCYWVRVEPGRLSAF